METKTRSIRYLCARAAHCYTEAYEAHDTEGMKIAAAKLEGIEKMLEIMGIDHENKFDSEHSYNLMFIII